MRANIADYNAVVEAASKFTRSVAEGNSKYAKELFTEDACLFGFLNGKFERGSIEQFYRNVDTVGAGENFKTRIDVLELEETLAVVRVLEEGWGGKIDFTDVLLLLKIDGEWKCVAFFVANRKVRRYARCCHVVTSLSVQGHNTPKEKQV